MRQVVIVLSGYLYTWIQTVMCYGRLTSTSGIGNFTVRQLHSRGASLEWGFNVTTELSGFEIVIRPVKQEHSHHHKLGAYVGDDGYQRRRVYQVNDLDPGTEYELFIYALGKDGVVSASDRIVFRTLSGEHGQGYKFEPDPLECFIVLSILIAWGVAFAVFVHKWGTIRIIQPGDYRPTVDPKNLENIKIVKKPTDSVIYRNYSQKYTSTMQAREKKIERMNTMPNIKVAQEEMIAMERISPSSPKISRFRDTFLQPDGSPKATSSLSGWMKSPSSSFGTFQLGLAGSKPLKDSENLAGIASSSYVDQLRSTALLMMDLKQSGDSRPKTGHHHHHLLEDVHSQTSKQQHGARHSQHQMKEDSPQEADTLMTVDEEEVDTVDDTVRSNILMKVDEEVDTDGEIIKTPKHSSRENLLKDRDFVLTTSSKTRPK